MVDVDIRIEDDWFDYLFYLLLSVVLVLFIFSANRSSMLGEDEGTYYKYARKMHLGTYDGYRFDGTPNPNPTLPSRACSIAFKILPVRLTTCKITTALFAVGTVALTYLIASKLSTKLGGVLAVAILMSFSYFTHFSLIFYTEIPIAFFAALTIYLAMKNNNFAIAVLLGVTMALAYFTKRTALMFPAAVFAYGIFRHKNLRYALTAVVITGLIWAGYMALNIHRYGSPMFPFASSIWKMFNPDSFDPYSPSPYEWLEEFEAEINPNINILPVFGIFPLLMVVTGISYTAIDSKSLFNNKYVILDLFLLLFILSWFFVVGEAAEARYVSVLFPVLAVYAAIPFAECAREKSIFMILALIIIGILLYQGFSSTLSNSKRVRFPPNYVQSLEWIERETPEDSVIFTVYGGSVYTYSHRERTWLYENFSEVMTTTDAEYIYDELKDRADYILLWRPLIAEHYVIPESNIYGVFTWNFTEAVLSREDLFKPVYNNPDTVVLEIVDGDFVVQED